MAVQSYKVNSSCAQNVLARFPWLQAVSTQIERPKRPSGSKRAEREFQAAVNKLHEHINHRASHPTQATRGDTTMGL